MNFEKEYRGFRWWWRWRISRRYKFYFTVTDGVLTTGMFSVFEDKDWERRGSGAERFFYHLQVRGGMLSDPMLLEAKPLSFLPKDVKAIVDTELVYRMLVAL